MPVILLGDKVQPVPKDDQTQRHLGADFLENVGASTSQTLIDLNGYFKGSFAL
jgi:hypothetical protein